MSVCMCTCVSPRLLCEIYSNGEWWYKQLESHWANDLLTSFPTLRFYSTQILYFLHD